MLLKTQESALHIPQTDLTNNAEIRPAFSLVELLHYCALIGRELHALKGPIIGALSDATPALLCHKEPAGVATLNAPIVDPSMHEALDQ